jgi:chromosome segregation ATPase
MTDRLPNPHLTRRPQMMPGNRNPEHAKDVVDRLFKNVPIPFPVRRQLDNLANTLEARKSELKGHITELSAQVGNLTRELRQVRELQSDDDLIALYNSGAKLLTRQADEIKDLKSELQRGKDERDRLLPKLAEKDKQISQVEDEKKNCREAMRRFQERLAGLELSSPAQDLQAKQSQELVILKQRLEDYRKMADEQQTTIKKLTKENDRLVMALGRQHFNEMDLP